MVKANRARSSDQSDESNTMELGSNDHVKAESKTLVDERDFIEIIFKSNSKDCSQDCSENGSENDRENAFESLEVDENMVNSNFERSPFQETQVQSFRLDLNNLRSNKLLESIKNHFKGTYDNTGRIYLIERADLESRNPSHNPKLIKHIRSLLKKHQKIHQGDVFKSTTGFRVSIKP